MRHTTPPLPEIRLWAQLSLHSTRSYINANSDYDAGENTDFEYASSDIYINANSDHNAGENTDFEYASSDINNYANSVYDYDGISRPSRRK